MNKTEMLKLNLGSRDRNMPGFANMDIDAHPGVDFVGDVSDLSRFGVESVAEIFASNILEHFPHTRTAEVLGEWHRVLVPGGNLYLSVPDFHRAVELYMSQGLVPWIQNFLMGDQGYKTAFHYALFNEDNLGRLCREAGFKFRVVSDFPFADKKDCSNLFSNQDHRRVCLNAIATKTGGLNK